MCAKPKAGSVRSKYEFMKAHRKEFATIDSIGLAEATAKRRAEIAGITKVGADGRAIDGGRSAAALLKRPQHNLTLRL